jgi:hypothetical protein
MNEAGGAIVLVLVYMAYQLRKIRTVLETILGGQILAARGKTAADEKSQT